jgi:hypothetical protein
VSSVARTTMVLLFIFATLRPCLPTHQDAVRKFPSLVSLAM